MSNLNFDELLKILTCSKHSSNKLNLIANQLLCTLCNGKVADVVSRSPVKIDFLDNFQSNLLTGSESSVTVKKFTNWKTENLNFLLEMKINTGITVDIGSGAGVFHPYLSLPTQINIDFTNYSSTNLISNLENDIPLSSKSVDSVIMANVLEHLQESKVIEEAYRILKINGRLLITIPFLLDVHQAPYDFHRYTHIYLTNLLQKSGFEITLIRPSGDFGTFQVLAEHYFRFKIDQGSFIAKLLWQNQKIINWFLKNTVQVSHRLEYTGGYMISAIKRQNTN